MPPAAVLPAREAGAGPVSQDTAGGGKEAVMSQAHGDALLCTRCRTHQESVLPSLRGFSHGRGLGWVLFAGKRNPVEYLIQFELGYHRYSRALL